MSVANRFVLLGLVWLVAAMTEGLWMGVTGLIQYLNLHIVMVLSGGTMGIVFGLILQGWPKVAGDPWAGPQFIAWNVAVFLQALGAIVRAWGWGDAPIAIASVLVLAAAAMMLVMFYRRAVA